MISLSQNDFRSSPIGFSPACGHAKGACLRLDARRESGSTKLTGQAGCGTVGPRDPVPEAGSRDAAVGIGSELATLGPQPGREPGPSGTVGRHSVNVFRGQRVSRHRHRVLCHTSRIGSGPYGTSRGRVVTCSLTEDDSTPHAGHAAAPTSSITTCTRRPSPSSASPSTAATASPSMPNNSVPGSCPCPTCHCVLWTKPVTSPS